MSDPRRDIIQDHYHRPRNRGALEAPAVTIRANNPLCGDEIVLSVLRSGDLLQDIRFDGKGCSIVLASASILTETVHGQSADEVRASIAHVTELLRAPGFPSATVERDADALQDVNLYPARIKCALLPWTTLASLMASDEQPAPRRT